MSQKYELKLVKLNVETANPTPPPNLYYHKGMPKLQYVVHDQPPVILQADIFNPSLAALLKLRIVKSHAFITAGNRLDVPPGSSAESDASMILANELKKRSLRLF